MLKALLLFQLEDSPVGRALAARVQDLRQGVHDAEVPHQAHGVSGPFHCIL